ncbi:MAG: hypothetical protein H6R00_604 [Proteobacteria bacterium]|nr:hypothetical protein [Pseudomonadota bacterium]
MLSEKCAEIDRDIKDVSAAVARRVRLAGELCLGLEEAEALERQFQASVCCVIEVPATSEEGARARRELIRKLMELDDYIGSLLRAPWARSESIANCRQNLDRCRKDLDGIKLR